VAGNTRLRPAATDRVYMVCRGLPSPATLTPGATPSYLGARGSHLYPLKRDPEVGHLFAIRKIWWWWLEMAVVGESVLEGIFL